MNVGILLDDIVPPAKYGGTGRVVSALAKQLVEIGQHVTLYARAGSHIENVDCRFLPSDFESVNSAQWLDPTLDVLHIHYPHRIKTDIPILLTQHGNSLYRVYPHMNFLSQSHASNHGTTCYNYNGIDVTDYPINPAKEDYICFLADARWGVKNLRTAVSLAEDTKTKLVVMGGTGVNTKYVEYRGMVGESEGKLEILSRAKALVYLANWDEPCAVAVLESLACGTPVIATKNGYFPEVLDDNCGCCVSSYSEAISAMKSVETKQAEVCRARLSSGFTTGQMAEKYMQLYREVVSGTWNYPVAKHTFNSPLKKVYKPTLRNIGHFEVRHRLSWLLNQQHDYSYRKHGYQPELCGF